MTPASPLKVSIRHAEPILRAGLAALLASRADIALSAAAPQVVITDFDDGLALARADDLPRQRILIVTQRDREWDVRTALAAGVHGYLLQHAGLPELLAALQALAAGQRHVNRDLMARAMENLAHGDFTARESQVLALLAQGCSNKLIARQLDIGVGTVKSHVKSLFGKLGATARTHAVVLATQRGIVCHPGGARSGGAIAA